jgi:hypothetical protein
VFDLRTESAIKTAKGKMLLVHKSVCVQEEIWRKLRINAELSGVSVRDYLSYLIFNSQPVASNDLEAYQQLEALAKDNQAARQKTTTGLISETDAVQTVAS